VSLLQGDSEAVTKSGLNSRDEEPILNFPVLVEKHVCDVLRAPEKGVLRRIIGLDRTTRRYC